MTCLSRFDFQREVYDLWKSAPFHRIRVMHPAELICETGPNVTSACLASYADSRYTRFDEIAAQVCELATQFHRVEFEPPGGHCQACRFWKA